MKAQWRTALFVSVLVAFLATILVFAPSLSAPVSAGDDLPAMQNPCLALPPNEPPPPSSGGVVPRKVPPGTPGEDANWPIVEKSVKTVTNRSGVSYTVTDTIRRNPSGNETASAVTASCSYYDSTSWHRTSTGGGITQHLKIYYDRYHWSDPTHYVYAYWFPKTETWWNRTNGSWGLGNSRIDWSFFGFDCSSVHRQYFDGGSFVPQWFNGGNQTWLYIWDPTKNWPVLTPQVQVNDYLATDLVTEYYQNGLYRGTIPTDITLN